MTSSVFPAKAGTQPGPRVKPGVTTRCARVLLPLGLLAAMPLPGYAAGSASGELLVSAATSLKDVMHAVTPLFERAHPGLKLRFNYGSSGQLRMQIENGAPVDLFVAAAMSDMDSLEAKGLVAPGTRAVVARNTLVLVRGRAGQHPLSRAEDLVQEGITRVAIGNPATVPAGRYAREALELRGLYGKLRDKLIFAETVRQVLDYVARGEVDAGFVFKTDALLEVGSEVVESIPSDQHAPILYPAAALQGGKDVPNAAEFVGFLRSKTGSDTFRKYGFE